MTAGSDEAERVVVDATREKIRAKALVHGQNRSADTRSRVVNAMATIEQEMAANGGIYPQNKGSVTGAELARRAGVHPTTFYSPKQRELGKEVNAWLESLKNRGAVSVASVKRSLAERVADWKQLYDALAQSHRDTELELQQMESDLGRAREELEAVTYERDALREQLAKLGGATIVPLRPKRK